MNMSRTPKEKLNEKFQSTVAKLAQDMPLLMHGAGDVQSKEVNPDTAMLVAALTTHYIEKLVEAAIDAHQMSRDNRIVREDPLLPPPAYRKSLQPPFPPPPESSQYNSISSNKNEDEENKQSRKRKYRSTIQYWDEPLPEPKIAGQETISKKNENDEVEEDKWVGLAGVDLFYNRTRSAYVQGPAVLSTQSFIFPVCHDTYTYGRILEQQAFKQSLEPVLFDPIVTELIQVEGQQQHARKTKKKKKSPEKKSSNGDVSDPEEDDGDASVDEETEKDIPEWPGLEGLIPFNF